MRELILSVLVMSLMISGCASVNNSVSNGDPARSETNTPEVAEQSDETSENQELSQPTTESESSFEDMSRFIAGVALGAGAAILGLTLLALLIFSGSGGWGYY